MDARKVRQAALGLARDARQTRRDVDARLARATSIDYWARLCPELSIGGRPTTRGLEVHPISAKARAEVVRRLDGQGYFDLPPVISKPAIRNLLKCIDTVRAAGWPAVFAFVYDQFWSLWRLPSLVALLKDALGPDYLTILHPWAYYVNPVRGASGWAPHLEGDEKSDRITIWIPFTDSTLDNGCMCVMPRDLMTRQMLERRERLGGDALKRMSFEETVAIMQGARPLPAKTGSIMGWHFDIYHWRLTCHYPSRPRISVSLEFARARSRAAGGGAMMIDPAGPLPEFKARVASIGWVMISYETHEPRVAQFHELANRLIEQGPLRHR